MVLTSLPTFHPGNFWIITRIQQIASGPKLPIIVKPPTIVRY